MSDEKDIKREQVFQYIISGIAKGEFRAGQSLSERHLSAKLGVSRTPVREAFRQLENLGLVRAEPHKGVTVSYISADQVRQLYLIREVLEGLGARLMAEIQNKDDIEKLRMLMEQAEDAAARDDISALSRINTQFHITIASASNNPYLETTMEMLQTHISLFMSNTLAQSGRPRQNLKEHWLILQAIESGDSALAEEAAKFHIRNALKTMMRNVLTYTNKDKVVEGKHDY